MQRRKAPWTTLLPQLQKGNDSVQTHLRHHPLRQVWKRRLSSLLVLLFVYVVIAFTVRFYVREDGTGREIVAAEGQRVGIVTVASAVYQDEYRRQSRTVSCYANRHHYAYFLMSGEEYPSCYMLIGFYRRKLCTVLEVMRRYSHLEVFSIQDIDVAVIQPERRIEEYLTEIDPKSTRDLFLMDRHTGEWAAGIYLVRNTVWARDFLATWVRTLGETGVGFKNALRNGLTKGAFKWFGNADNGALHASMLRVIFANNNETRVKCEQLRSDATNIAEYAEFVKCVRSASDGLIARGVVPVHVSPMQESYTSEAFFARERRGDRSSGFVYTFRSHSRLIMIHGVKSKYENDFFKPEESKFVCQSPQLQSNVHRIAIGIQGWNKFFRQEIHQEYGQYVAWRKERERSSGFFQR